MTKYWPYILLSLLWIMTACEQPQKSVDGLHPLPLNQEEGVSLVVLGTVQDAGAPHIACKKECCKALFDHPDPSRKVVSLGLIDHTDKKTYLFEATPDISTQVKMLKTLASSDSELPNGIFLTHAHIGHYSGLMYLGREATNADAVPVYSMPKMANFLRSNGPWSQLVSLENIALQKLKADSTVALSQQLKITPFRVPHRDEFSETVGYHIKGPNKSAVFIPDIDKWSKWERSIVATTKAVDYVFVDATFYSGDEINTRDISEIPHPFIIESMELFKTLSPEDKSKVHFIHFNHTNPALDPNSDVSREIINKGYQISRMLDVRKL